MEAENRLSQTIVLGSRYRGWILDGLAHESAKLLNHTPKYIYLKHKRLSLDFIKRAMIKDVLWENGLVFINHNTFLEMHFEHQELERLHKVSKVLFTHYIPDSKGNHIDHLRRLNIVSEVLVFSARDKSWLLETGVTDTKISVIGGFIDRNKFHPAKSGHDKEESEYVIIVGDCKERKNPRLIEQVIRQNPNINFLIHGRHWNTYEVTKLRNVIYIEFDQSHHCDLMRNASAFLSLSNVEGGPFPTLEALASGTPVVVTDTGWNAEYVTQDNGFLIKLPEPIDSISKKLSEAIGMKKAVKHRDLIQGRAIPELFANSLLRMG
jgi:glycosyltransferase involved in cell wall biosynthesis